METSSAAVAPSELGAAEFLTKPVDFDFLKAQLRQLPTAAN
jgi:DNA-binding response OmpR family regulator